MKKFMYSALLLAVLSFSALEAANIGFVNIKTIVDESKVGKQEQASFESMKDQMEKILEEKEKELTEMAEKFNDPDYLDTLSNEAEGELKKKFRQLNQDFSEKQSQFMQVLQQANMKIMQKLTEEIQKASEQVAKNKKLDAVFNQDAGFFTSKDLDVSLDVVKIMDASYQENAKTNERPAPKS